MLSEVERELLRRGGAKGYTASPTRDKSSITPALLRDRAKSRATRWSALPLINERRSDDRRLYVADAHGPQSYAVERNTNEAYRLTHILDKRLSEPRYAACDEYTIADMAIFPWMRGAENRGVKLEEYPNVKAGSMISTCGRQ